MKKRILSLLLCIVLCLSLMPTVAFAESQLPDPANVRLSNDMMLTWDPVDGANEYVVQLIVKDNELDSSNYDPVGNVSATSIDLSSYIPSTKRNSRFSYIAKVRAINESNNAMSNFSDSNKVSGADFGEQSTQYTITVNGGRAALNSSGERIIYGADSGDTIYLIPTIPEGQEFYGWTVNTPSGLELSATLPTYFTMPSSNVEVTAKYEKIPITELPDPTNVRLSNDMMLTWEAVDGANEYVVQLIVKDNELDSSNYDLVGNVSATSIDLSSNIPSTKRNSRFSYIAKVRAINKSNNAMSDFSDSNK
ncbi:MAG: hypothetical protein MJ116_10140, partial [Lachnospiraceae bacterium]|nr:hypothetical protein [Lachnospiraceae bacterium]